MIRSFIKVTVKGKITPRTFCTQSHRSLLQKTLGSCLNSIALLKKSARKNGDLLSVKYELINTRNSKKIAEFAKSLRNQKFKKSSYN